MQECAKVCKGLQRFARVQGYSQGEKYCLHCDNYTRQVSHAEEEKNLCKTKSVALLFLLCTADSCEAEHATDFAKVLS